MQQEEDENMEPGFDPHGFDGVWRMYLPDSTVLDPATGEMIPEVLTDQVLEIRTTGDVMDYKIRVDHSPELSIFMTYRCQFGAVEWTPYTVYHIEGDANDPALRPGPLLKSGTRLGEPMAFIKQVYVDPRTQYRITRNPDGTAQYLMLRRLSEDGRRNVGTVLTAEGERSIDKHFLRDEGPAPEWP
jgi:hypothetical protein